MESSVATRIVYALGILNTIAKEDNRIQTAQIKLYRRALGLAPPFMARKKGLEIIYNKELEILTERKSWTDKIKEARVRLLRECRTVGNDSPIA